MKPRNLINRLLALAGYQLVRQTRETIRAPLILTRDYILAHRLERTRDFFFVQIGANDGFTNDDIHDFIVRHQLRGIAVEPLPDMFSKLKVLYEAQPQVACVKKAIHRTKRRAVLHRLRADHDLPEDFDGIASFDPTHHLKWIDATPAIEGYLETIEVDCITLDELFATHNVTRIDLLQVDTEGYDGEIIRGLNFDRIRPSIIRYERKHLSRAEERKIASLLTLHGYRLFDDDRKDVIAYDPDASSD